ncbi:MAG TPA: hypothetical protein VM689_14695 [Aliidongia sp.]|nr:hypothetical protein [Aliidongia sp.]
MSAKFLDRRLRLQLELSFAQDPGAETLLCPRETQARALGLTGAEIDAARAGRAFDVRAAGAMALCRALRMADPTEIAAARQHASAIGIDAEEIVEIERLATSKSADFQDDGA